MLSSSPSNPLHDATERPIPSLPHRPAGAPRRNAARLADCALRLCSAAIEVAPLPPERLLALGGEPAAAFIAPGGDAWVGLGAARWLEPGSADASPLWEGLLDESPQAPAPAALGALPYAADETPDALWQGLMPGGVMLPERLYVQQGGRAWWRLTLPLAEAGSLRARLAQERRTLASLAADEARTAEHGDQTLHQLAPIAGRLAALSPHRRAGHSAQRGKRRRQTTIADRTDPVINGDAGTG